MKRLSLIILTLLGIICQSRAQIYFNIYQNEVVLNRIPAYEVDSITVTETSPHLVRLWYDGNVIVSYDSEEIDSINVSNDDDPLSYMGIVGFNDELYKKEIDVLATSTAGQFRSFVSSLPRKDGTLLYYAVDNAIDMLGNSGISTPLSCINLITFTDGLDQGSIMMNTRYSSSKEYLNAMSKLIRNSEYNGLPINAYSVGLRGTDVSDITSFRNNLSLLASSADKSFEVNSIYDLRTKFQEIANQIISVSIRQTISLKIPGIDSGTRVRFVFDGQTAENSDLYIEGTFNLSDLTLRNVTYHGMRSRSGNIVQGTQDGIFVTFTFLGLQREDASQAIPTHIRHYYMLPSSSTWQQNSEFSPENNTQRTISHSGTIVVLVLDCSNSLGNDFNKVKQYANDFIDMIAQNTQPFSLKAPENAKAELDGENFTIVVSWDPVKYAEYYRVYRSSSNYNVYNLIADNVTLTSWTDKTPFSGNNYYWIEAIGHGLGIVGDCTNVVEYKLGTPENAKVVWNDNDDVVVSWDAVKYAEGYQVYRSYSSGGTYSLVAENVTSISWIDKAPLAGNNYYRIKAVGHGLTSGYSNTTNVLQYALDAPMNSKAELDDANFYIVVSWGAVKHAEGYQVYRCGSSGGTYSLVAENVTSISWTDKTPLSGRNYYQIEAVGHGIKSEKTTPCLCVVFTNSYVDLSLPSGTLWATMNVGASKPEDYGDFFAWGETEPKSDYNGNNYFDASYSKYNKSSNTELLPEDDVAYVKWGYDWCMPSKNQLAELINSSYTTKEWTTYNGVKGHWITSKTNWNSIFLPAGGIIRGSSREKEGSYGYYWSRTIDINYSGYAWHLYNYSNGLYVRDNNDTNFGRRMYGLNVRPVRSKE